MGHPRLRITPKVHVGLCMVVVRRLGVVIVPRVGIPRPAAEGEMVVVVVAVLVAGMGLGLGLLVVRSGSRGVGVRIPGGWWLRGGMGAMWMMCGPMIDDDDTVDVSLSE